MNNNALSQFFPFLERHQAGADEMLSSMFSIASVGIATLKMLETLLPFAASEVEREAGAMTEHFTLIAKYIQCQEVPAEINNAVSGIIMGMQFQDRNTQVMDNVAGILERYRTMLEDICGNITAAQTTETASTGTLSRAVEDILSSIRLSDIRERYLQALTKAKMHSPGEVLSLPESSTHEDIELF